MGRFRVLPPFAFVGKHGTQKYLIKSLPSLSFCCSSPRTAPAPSSDSGKPKYAAQVIVHFQESGERYSPCGKTRYFDKHTRSKFALNAHFVAMLSVMAERISGGIFSPPARSTACTSPPSTE